MESKKINQLATELAPVLSDLTIIGDPTTGISRKITLSQMASLFTGTVEEYPNLVSFPLVGTADTIYIALDTNIIYRWNTSTNAYVELSPNIVTSLVFNDANGFDGTINLVGSTATLTITTALTQGSVPFIGTSGALTQDNANLFFDDTNNRLGINTNSPTTALDVFGSGIIGRLNGTSTNNAFLGFASAGTNRWSIGNVQSDHRFRIYSETNTSELVSVLQTGEFGIGIANPTTKLHIDGGATALIANLDANVSVAKSISFRSDNSNRINLEVSGTESGSNAGANFFIRRYSDAGALLDTPFTITRSTGAITLATALSGTSATLSGNLTMNTNNSSAIKFTNAAGSGTAWDMFADSANNAYFRNSGSGGFIFTNGTTNFLSIASTGLSTFGGNIIVSNNFQNQFHYFTSSAGTGTQQISVIGSNSGVNGGYVKIINDSATAGVRGIRLGLNGNGVAAGSGVDIITITDNTFVGIGFDAPAYKLDVRGAYDASGIITVRSTNTATIDVGGVLGFGGFHNGSSNQSQWAWIKGAKENSNVNDNASYISLATMTSGASPTEKLRLTSAGLLLINTTTNLGGAGVNYYLQVNGPAHFTEISLGDTYNRVVSTDSSWSSFQTIIPTATLEVYAVYLITASFSVGGPPYNVTTSFTFVAPNCNGGGGDNEFLPICATHQGGTGTMSFRAVAAGSQNSSGLQVKFNGFASLTGTLTLRATRLKRNIN